MRHRNILSRIDNREKSLTIKIIIKLTKDKPSGKFLLNLAYLLSVEVRPLARLQGSDSDNFNWFTLQITGEIERLVTTLMYLNDCGIEVIFLNSEREE